MEPARKCITGRLADGTITVDGKPYPMASEVLATEDRIHAHMKATAAKIAAYYKGLSHRDTHTPGAGSAEAPISYDNPLIILSILKGSYIFTADFVRYLQDAGLPNVCDFMRLSSYNDGTKSTGTVTMHWGPKFEKLEGKHVLVLEDVCDSGRTLSFLEKLITERYRPKSLRFCVLVNKQASARRVAFQPEFSCMSGPDKYIVGYGFEVNDRYRDFRHIFLLADGEAGRYPAKL